MLNALFRLLLVFLGFVGLVYLYSLPKALDDELLADAKDCAIWGTLQIVAYAMIYFIYYNMHSILPEITSGLLIMGIFYLILFFCYYIRSLAAFQKGFDDGKIHFRHKKDA
jgi:hypothetical protein